MEKQKTILNSLINKTFPKGSFALDLGSGVGVFSFLMAKSGLTVMAVDSNAVTINKLQDSRGNLDVSTSCEDITRFDIEKDKYRVILARNIFPFIRDKEVVKKTIEEIATGLTKDGEFLFTLFGPEDDWAEKVNMSFFTFEEILPTLEKAGLKIVESDTYSGEGKTMDGDSKHWHIHTYLVKPQ